MNLSNSRKQVIKQRIRESLSVFPEVQKIVIFGSFPHSNDPEDIDIAVFQNSEESFFPLSVRYRMPLQDLAEEIPIDLMPIKTEASPSAFLDEILKGESIYEVG